MSYEMIIGLQIKSNEIYNHYRETMKPILRVHGGGFRYDFKISEVLSNEDGNPINRVFAIYFENEQRKDDFFSNPEYIEVKKEFFETSVESTTIISEYTRD